MDENNALIEQYLDSLAAPEMTEVKGKQLQDAFVKRCQQNPALELAYLEHPRAEVDQNDPEVVKTIAGLKALVAQRKT